MKTASTATARESLRQALRVYTPLLLLLLGQAALVAVLPSRADKGVSQLAFNPSERGTDAASSAVPGDVRSSEGSTGSGPNAATSGDGPLAGQPPGSASVGDTSHCTPDGRQVDVTVHSPPCVAAFTGSNGGSTHPGVTADEIKVVYVMAEQDPQTQLLLEQAGYLADPEVTKDFLRTAVNYVNSHYELYGRKINLTIIEKGCPTIPDEDRCRAVVRDVIRQQPFAVIWFDYGYPDLIGEFARAGIVSLDLGAYDGSHYDTFAPYRWSLWTDGRQTSAWTSQYYCNAMAGGNATHSGSVIHPAIGSRGQVSRKIGIVSIEFGAFLRTAERLRDELTSTCGVPKAQIYTYDFNLDTLPQRCQAITSSLINEKVTTVVWAGDGTGPTFCTPTMTAQQYYPEHLITGGPVLDVNGFARLFDQEQWRHAFGVSVVPTPALYTGSEEARMWRAMRREPYTCKTCTWIDVRTLGFMLQVAGPDLNPINLANAVFAAAPTGGWAATHGDPTIERVSFGPNDYTTLSDWREVYWDPDARDSGDGSEGGAYVAVNGGRRYLSGEYPRQPISVPVAPR